MTWHAGLGLIRLEWLITPPPDDTPGKKKKQPDHPEGTRFLCVGPTVLGSIRPESKGAWEATYRGQSLRVWWKTEKEAKTAVEALDYREFLPVLEVLQKLYHD